MGVGWRMRMRMRRSDVEGKRGWEMGLGGGLVCGTMSWLILVVVCEVVCVYVNDDLIV